MEADGLLRPCLGEGFGGVWPSLGAAVLLRGRCPMGAGPWQLPWWGVFSFRSKGGANGAGTAPQPLSHPLSSEATSVRCPGVGLSGRASERCLSPEYRV